MDFYKGRIPPNTVQIALNRQQILPLSIFSVSTPDDGVPNGILFLDSLRFFGGLAETKLRYSKQIRLRHYVRMWVRARKWLTPRWGHYFIFRGIHIYVYTWALTYIWVKFPLCLRKACTGFSMFRLGFPFIFLGFFWIPMTSKEHIGNNYPNATPIKASSSSSSSSNSSWSVSS